MLARDLHPRGIAKLSILASFPIQINWWVQSSLSILLPFGTIAFTFSATNINSISNVFFIVKWRSWRELNPCSLPWQGSVLTTTPQDRKIGVRGRNWTDINRATTCRSTIELPTLGGSERILTSGAITSNCFQNKRNNPNSATLPILFIRKRFEILRQITLSDEVKPIFGNNDVPRNPFQYLLFPFLK